MKKIAQIGTFDVENFGDILFPDVLDFNLGDGYQVDLYSPIGGIKPFDTRKVYPISELNNNIKKYDAIIIGGGDIIRTDCKICIVNDCYGYSSEPSLQLWAYPIMSAKRNNIPVIFNAVGITNNFTNDEKYLVKSIIELVDYVAVRDTEAFNTLQQIGVDRVKIVPDSVFSISKFLKSNELTKIYDKLIDDDYIPKLENFIIFQHNSTNINNEEYYKDLIKLVKRVSKDHKVLLMPIGYIHDDNKVLEKIYSEKIDNVYIVNKKHKLSPIEMISIISKSYGYIGTSMHGAVVSSSYNKKIMILNQMNAKKLHGVSNLLNKMELDVNLSSHYEYVYDKYYESQNITNINKIIGKIDNHFKFIKDIINSPNKTDKFELNFDDYIRNYYNEKNNEEIYGFYYQDSYLNRKLFNYVTNNELLEINIKTKEKIKYHPTNNEILFVEYIKINDKKTIINDYINNDFELVCTPMNGVINIIIKYRKTTIDDLFYLNKNKDNEIKNLRKELECQKELYTNLDTKYKFILHGFFW